MVVLNKFSNAKKDDLNCTAVQNTPGDTISSIAMNDNLVVVGSWDSAVRVYRKATYSSSMDPHKIFENLGAPVLSVCLINDMLSVAGLVDGNLVLLNLNDSSTKKIKAHDGGIKGIMMFKNEYIITCSFDGFYKIFDSNFKEVHGINCNNKIYCMDCKDGHLVMGLNNKKVVYVDLNNNNTQEYTTRFQYAIRSISCEVTSYGVEIAVGSVEGKVEIFNTKSPGNSVLIRLHRSDDKLYAINGIKFVSPTTIITTGSDGLVQLTNKNTRYKMASSKFDAPITAVQLNGKSLVFAVGDDWSRGFQPHNLPTQLMCADLSTFGNL